MQPRTLARRFTLVVFLALGLSPAASAKATSSSYTLTVAGPADSAAAGVNASGQIVGNSGGSAFVWTPTTNSRVVLDFGAVVAYGINDAGRVVGTYISSSEDRAFVWTNGSVQFLLPPSGHTVSGAYAINDSGVVVGGSSNTSTSGAAVCWSGDPATPVVLSTEVGVAFSVAHGINASGQMVGVNQDSGRAYSWSSPTNVSVLSPLHEGDVNVAAHGINASGQIVGISDDGSTIRAVRWENASVAPIDLCTISTAYSSASAINASGQVVGSVELESGASGFLYSDGAMTDINTLLTGAEGWTITNAVGINDLGWIAATAWDGSASYAVLLTPEGTAIPEPSTYAALLGVGVLGWAAWKRRRRAA